jgi:uncharacterized repeat protein (TIGR02543 family)
MPSTGKNNIDPITQTLVVPEETRTLIAPTQTGYTFQGYFLGTGGTGAQYYTSSMASARTWDIASNDDLFGFFIADPYTITFNQQSGTGGTASTTATYDSPMPSITLPTRTGYTFQGYYTGASGTGVKYYNFDGTSARNWDQTSGDTLFAYWIANSFVVILNAGGGTTASNSAISITYETSIEAFNVNMLPTRTGFIFNGYYTEPSGGILRINSSGYVALTNTTYTALVTLYAQWTANSFTITLDANGGTTASNSGISVTYATSIESFNVNMRPTRTGYTFNGYYTATSGGTQRISSTAYVALTSTTYTAAVTLFAQWTANQYEVSFDNGGGSGTMPNQLFTAGTAFNLSLNTFTKTGYLFNGWTVAAANGSLVYTNGQSLTLFGNPPTLIAR